MSVAAGAPAVDRWGLRVTLPPRWEARLYLRADAGAGAGHADELVHPVLHLANFALPPGRGDFGSGAVERMGPGHAFVALLEYEPDEAGRALFAAAAGSPALPRPSLRDFAPNQLQRRLPGQLGRQVFFAVAGRPFCLYVVLGSRAHAAPLLDEVHAALAGIEVSPWRHR